LRRFLLGAGVVLASFLFLFLSVFVGVDGLVSVDVPRQNVSVEGGDVSNEFDPPRYNYIQAPSFEADYERSVRGVDVRVDSVMNVYGSSMRPTMFTGDKALAVDYENQSLSEGDIVSANGFVHRIKADYTETGGVYLTQGDNNVEAEEVKPSEIDSVVVGVLFGENE